MVKKKPTINNRDNWLTKRQPPGLQQKSPANAGLFCEAVMLKR
jgi:hypothetical protein